MPKPGWDDLSLGCVCLCVSVCGDGDTGACVPCRYVVVRGPLQELGLTFPFV